ncbi:MAG: hypothetical protein ACI9RM_002514 [Ulvibacter sp.]|jgi:hypothetical protein
MIFRKIKIRLKYLSVITFRHKMITPTKKKTTKIETFTLPSTIKQSIFIFS